jgi:hypothetical protein
MLQPLHRQRYLEFKLALQELQATVAATDLHPNALRNHCQNVQQLFHSQIASLNADDLAPEQASRWQSLQTEIPFSVFKAARSHPYPDSILRSVASTLEGSAAALLIS